MRRFLLPVIFMLAPGQPTAGNMTGTVCLGQNLAKPAAEHTKRLYLKVNNSEKIFFNEPYTGPQFVARGLDTSTLHTISVYFDDAIIRSWKLDFTQLKTTSVLIWRAAGSWRMEANDAALCK